MFTAQGALPSEKVSVVPHGIPPRRRATRSGAKTDFRDAHGVSNSTFLFLYVGALLPRKGWDILLDAWCQAFRPDDHVALVVKTSYSHGGDTSEVGSWNCNVDKNAAASFTYKLGVATMTWLRCTSKRTFLCTQVERRVLGSLRWRH